MGPILMFMLQWRIRTSITITMTQRLTSMWISRVEFMLLGLLTSVFVGISGQVAEAVPSSSVLSASTSKSSTADGKIDERDPISALLTQGYGFTPWGEALMMSDRYVMSLRTETLNRVALNAMSAEAPNQSALILSDFDRYVLARASSHSLTQLSPLYEARMSLSHNWRRGASGYVLNAHQMNKSSFWINRRFKNYGTPEMIATIKAGVQELNRRFPDAPKLIIGDLSKRYGGHFPPHLSHQSGRDADLGYFIRGNYAYRLKGLTKVTRRTMDVAKTWAFLSGMLKTGLVESAFIDYQLQKVLYRYAKRDKGWTKEQLDHIFSYPAWKGGVINHLRGHSDHMHVRFKAPLSVAAAKSYMSTHGHRKLRPRRVYTKSKRGENLIKLGRRFRVNWKTLRKWNRLSIAQARRPLKRTRKYLVGYYTPYYARHIKFPLNPAHKEDPLDHILSRTP